MKMEVSTTGNGCIRDVRSPELTVRLQKAASHSMHSG